MENLRYKKISEFLQDILTVNFTVNGQKIK